MATYFIDIDGTVFKHGTEEWLPGAKEYIANLHKLGHKIIFITRRGADEFGQEGRYGAKSVLRAGEELIKIAPRSLMITDVKTPRIIIDDDIVGHVSVKSNEGFTGDEKPSYFIGLGKH